MIPDPLRNAQGERLATTFVPGRAGDRELVVIGHGLTSDKDRPWSEGLSRRLQQAGIASLRLAFSGNGDSEGRFEDSNITKEVADLRAVLAALPEWRTAYVGHSLGGAVGVVCAAGDPRLRALVTLAAVTHCAEWVEHLFGRLAFGSPLLDKPRCPYGPALKADLLAIGSTAEYAPQVAVPWLIVHGTQDEVVPIEHSLDLCAAAREAQLVRLEGVDHSFTGAGLDAMLAAVVPWLVGRLVECPG
jgi:hypothetical protein